jgi:hypothetical protein
VANGLGLNSHSLSAAFFPSATAVKYKKIRFLQSFSEFYWGNFPEVFLHHPSVISLYLLRLFFDRCALAIEAGAKETRRTSEGDPKKG